MEFGLKFAFSRIHDEFDNDPSISKPSTFAHH